MDFLFPATITTPLDRFAFLFLLLILYSFLGWCGEMVYCSLAHWRLCEKRGFLNGPLCPIYGHGALLVLLILRGGCGSPVLTFLLGGLLTTALEYVTSWAMEKLFHMRWWDYSNRFCNLGGRVCLLNSTLFGLASAGLCHWLSPIVNGWVLGLFDLGVAVPLAAVLLVLYLADIVLSVRSAIQIGSRLAKLHAIQEEFSRKLEELRAEQQRVLETQLEKLSQGRERLGEGIAAAREAAGARADQAAQALQSRLEPLGELRGEFAQRLEQMKAEAQRRARELYEGQDFFERRLMRAFPKLRSPLHSDALKKLREYWASRKKH